MFLVVSALLAFQCSSCQQPLSSSRHRSVTSTTQGQRAKLHITAAAQYQGIKQKPKHNNMIHMNIECTPIMYAHSGSIVLYKPVQFLDSFYVRVSPITSM